jgi:hypothetical protein
MSENIFYLTVTAGLSLRFLSSNKFPTISRKLRNLQDAATRPNIPFGTGGHKLLNLGFSEF